MPYTEAVLLETLRKANRTSTALPHPTNCDLTIIDGVVCKVLHKLALVGSAL